MKTKLILIALFASIAFSGTAQDRIAIAISKKTTVFNPLVKKYKRTRFLTLSNLGRKSAYVILNVYDMSKKNGTYSQKDTLKKSFGILVIPRKMIVKPGRSKRITITELMKNPKQERDFDLQFEYAKVPKTANLDLSDEKPVGIQVDLKNIRHGYVYVLPRKQKIDFTHSIDKANQAITFKNTGNMTVEFYAGKQCIEEKCQNIKTFFLLPKTTHALAIPLKQLSGELTLKNRSALETLSPVKLDLSS